MVKGVLCALLVGSSQVTLGKLIGGGRNGTLLQRLIYGAALALASATGAAIPILVFLIPSIGGATSTFIKEGAPGAELLVGQGREEYSDAHFL